MSYKQIPREYLYTAIRVLSLCALFFASMLAVDYYFNANTFCHEGASCEIVAKSEFGQKYGIFLPTLGLVAYTFFFMTSFFFAKTKWKVFGLSTRTFWVPLASICCAIGALLFIIVQAIEINAFCWLCMGIDTSAILMTSPAILLMLGMKSDLPNKKTLGNPLIWIAMYIAIVGGPLTWGMYNPPALDTTAASATAIEYQQQIDTKVPEFIRSKYVKGKVNIYEISSFGCPFCQKLHPILNDLIKEYGEDKINVARTTLPIHMSDQACAAYYCADKLGKGTEFANCMFEDTPKDEGKDIADIIAHGDHCNLPKNDFVACINSDEARQAIIAERKSVKDAGFQGAPTVWIDAQQIVGLNDVTVYRQAIEMNPIMRKDEPSTTKEVEEASILTTTHAPFYTILVIAFLVLISGLVLAQKAKEENSHTA